MKRPRGAFTLIELLVAISLGVVLIGVITFIWMQSSRIFQSSSTNLESYQRLRVILDMLGSSYATLLDVRKGPDCPGTEVPLACAAGYFVQRSFLDLTLSAGTYFLQIDGYAGQAGPWFLDVRVVDP